MKLKIYSLMSVLIISLFLIGCGNQTHLTYDNVNVKLSEHSVIPNEISQEINKNRYMDENKQLDYVQIEISGNPTDNFRGDKIFSLMSFYDENGNLCSVQPLNGLLDDVLTKEKIDVSLIVDCRTKKAVIRESDNEFLDDVNKVWEMKASQSISEAGLEEVKEKLDSYKQYYNDEEAQRRKENAAMPFPSIRR